MRDDDDLYDDYKDQMFDPDFFVEPAQKSEPAEEAEVTLADVVRGMDLGINATMISNGSARLARRSRTIGYLSKSKAGKYSLRTPDGTHKHDNLLAVMALARLV